MAKAANGEIDKEKLVKLLMMTTSDNDSEALVALRMANRLLQSAKLSWIDLFTTDDPATSNTPTPPEPKTAQELMNEYIEEMFAFVRRQVAPTSSFHDFIDSLADYYEEHGALTEKQFAALERAYQRAQFYGRRGDRRR
jgi:type II secretory pathway pseudopilin PulG